VDWHAPTVRNQTSYLKCVLLSSSQVMPGVRPSSFSSYVLREGARQQARDEHVASFHLIVLQLPSVTSESCNRQHQSCLTCYFHPFTTSKISFILSQSLEVLRIPPQLLNASLLDIHTPSQAPRRAQTLLSCHLPPITMSLLNHEFRLRLAIAATRSINGLPSDYTPMKQ
jgi:hypothetical protein